MATKYNYIGTLKSSLTKAPALIFTLSVGVLLFLACPQTINAQLKFNVTENEISIGNVGEWSDSPLSVLYNTNGENYWLHSSDWGKNYTKFQGTLDAPTAKQLFHKTGSSGFNNPKKVLGGFWVMGMYKHTDGTLLASIHNEKANGINQGNMALCLAKSIDNGDSWIILGRIMEQHCYGDTVTNICGSNPVVKDGYIYVYYMEADSLQGSETHGAVVRAELKDVLLAASKNTVCSWYKYYNGAWNEQGLRGRSSSVGNANIGNHSQIGWSDYAHEFINATFNREVFASPDGVTWRSLGCWPGTKSFYYSIVNPDKTFNGVITSRDFYVYYADLTNLPSGNWLRVKLQLVDNTK